MTKKKELTAKEVEKIFNDIIKRIKASPKKEKYNAFLIFSDGNHVSATAFGLIENFPRMFTCAEEDEQIHALMNYLQRNIVKIEGANPFRASYGESNTPKEDD